MINFEKLSYRETTLNGHTIVFRMEGEFGSYRNQELRERIMAALKELKKAKDDDDIEVIKSKTEALVQSSLKLGEAIYKQNPQGATPQPDPSGAEPSSENKNEKVVDADFEEIDENKKD